MLQGISQEQFRPVRFIEMEENDNGATRVVFVSDQVYSTREVLTNAFGIRGCPLPYVIEGGVTVVERVIHHISTYRSEFIDVYYQEIYTGQVAEDIPDYIERHIGKTVQVVFQENMVTTETQMANPIVTITEELEEVWEFATQNFVMNHHDDYFLLFGMTYRQCECCDYDGRLLVNYSFIPKEETYMEYYCEVCDTNFDGRDEQAVHNHQMCVDNANRQLQSDPDAVDTGDTGNTVVVVEDDSDSDSEEDDSDNDSEEDDSDSDSEEEDSDNEIDNENIYIPREIDWNDPVDDEEDDEQRNIQRNRNENENRDTDVERGEEEIADFISAHYPPINSNITRRNFDFNNNNITVGTFPGLIGEPPRIST